MKTTTMNTKTFRQFWDYLLFALIYAFFILSKVYGSCYNTHREPF